MANKRSDRRAQRQLAAAERLKPPPAQKPIRVVKQRRPRTAEDFYAHVERLGLQADRSGNHVKIRQDGRVLVTLPGTPSDWRAYLNASRDLEHALRGADR